MKEKSVSGLFIANESLYSFEKSIEVFSEKIAQSSWKMPAIHDLQETLHKNGEEVLPVKILEICSPEYASRLLSVDSLRIYSPMLPCRVSLYETSDGRVYFSRMNIDKLLALVDGPAAEIIADAYKDVENILEGITKFNSCFECWY